MSSKVTKLNHIVLVGPFPDPFNGVSMVNESLNRRLVELTGCGFSVHKTSSNRKQKHLGKFVRFMANLSFLPLSLLKSNRVMYISIAGGIYQWLDVFYLLIARLCRARVYVHHHSFNYLNQKQVLSALLFRVCGPDSKHIVLGQRMGDLLRDLYPVVQRTQVLSNVAFMNVSQFEEGSSAKDGVFTIGFLSNICSEKGGDLVEIIKLVSERKIPVRFKIAGPFVNAALEAQLVALSKLHPSIELIGPVYNDKKSNFFDSLNLFIFPTKYHNEAEPLVLWEAMKAGVPFLSYNRGVIAELTVAPMCEIVADVQGMLIGIEKVHSHFLNDSEDYNNRRQDLSDFFTKNREKSMTTLDHLLLEL